jgi:hypothetical protein
MNNTPIADALRKIRKDAAALSRHISVIAPSLAEYSPTKVLADRIIASATALDPDAIALMEMRGGGGE